MKTIHRRRASRGLPWLLSGLLSIGLTACGGGSDSTTALPITPIAAACPPFTDSFNKPVTCEEMAKLAGVDLGYADGAGDGATGAGDAGADGTGADGAAIANMELEFKDVNGKVVTTKTDANGYYRISLRGMKAPLVATVKRNGNPWKSMLVSDIVRAPANRQFYTINLTGLTDVVASEVAKKAGQTSADALTPAMVLAQKDAIPAIVTQVNTSIASQLTAAGIDPAKFDPLTTAFVPNKAGYDQVLETTPINRTPSGQTVTVNTEFKWTVGDLRIYTVTNSDGSAYTNNRTITQVSNGVSTQVENAYSNGSATVTANFQDGNRISEGHSTGWSCTYTPALVSESSAEVARLTINQSYTAPQSTRTCTYTSTGQISTSTYNRTYKMIGYEDVQTSAGVFKNTRIIERTDSGSNSVYTMWIDPILNREVRFTTQTTTPGIAQTTARGELTTISIKNY